MSGKYTVGIDFGTLSARAVLVSAGDGREIGSSEYVYPHGVISPGPDWALQYPGDYTEALRQTVPDLLSGSGVDKSDVIAVGIDFTSCTVLPIDRSGEPLCMSEKYKDNPYAKAMLWKHRGGKEYARRMTGVARDRGEEFLKYCGGSISCEWLFPKLLQIYTEAPQVYASADIFIEAGDWIVKILTGKLVRSACMAGYKAMWSKERGYPSGEYLDSVAPGFGSVTGKLRGKIIPPGVCCGTLTAKAAALTGLCEGTAVSAPVIDAHSAMLSPGGIDENRMMMIIGTSACQLVLSEKLAFPEGICGIVRDGIVPGYYAYEAGQNCVGDAFAWFTENCVPQSVQLAASERDMNIHDYLCSLASKKKPGETRLIALDWWGGNRSVLADPLLSGVIIGLTLATRPEDIYRALIEATAFGARRIIESYNRAGIEIKTVVATGGIAARNQMLMQIYADVTGMKITLSGAVNGAAHGAAVLAASAAGKSRGGYDTPVQAGAAMGRLSGKSYLPIPENTAVYNRLYAEYIGLHDWFGRGGNDIMKRL